MKNKITSLVISSVMMLPLCSAFAQAHSETTKVLVAAYDVNKRLIAVKCSNEYSFSETDNFYTVALEEKIENADTYKLVIYDNGKIVSNVNVKTTAMNDTTVTEPAVKPSEKPESTPKPAPSTESAEPTAYPSVYPSKKDAVNALILVKEVSQTIDADDNAVTKIKGFYQGGEIELWVDDETELKYVDNISEIKSGDMLHMTNSLSGKIKTISLDYRPSTEDIMRSKSLPSSFQIFLKNSSGKNFESELGKNDTGYVFGVITDKSSSTVTLYDTNGLADDSVELAYSGDTIVYTVDMSSRTPKTEIAGKSAVSKSSITKTYFDEDDNITEWNRYNTYYYALANVIDGEIVEMIVYNYDRSGH